MKDKNTLLSQLYERHVVRKARVTVDDNSHVLAKYCELLPSGIRFSFSEQIKSVQRSAQCVYVCVCVCVSVCVWQCVCVCVCVCVSVCKLRELLVCLICNFCIFNKCSLSFKMYNMCHCVVNVQPRFNFSDDIIILNLEWDTSVAVLCRRWPRHETLVLLCCAEDDPDTRCWCYCVVQKMTQTRDASVAVLCRRWPRHETLVLLCCAEDDPDMRR